MQTPFDRAADCIAEALHDLNRDRWIDPFGSSVGVEHLSLLQDATPVDVTSIHRDLIERGEGVDVYETTMRPPWLNALLCYYAVPADSGRDTVFMMGVTYVDHSDEWADVRWDSTADTHTIDWSLVRWIGLATMHQWNREHGVVGPMCAWKFCVNEDGTMQDLHTIGISDKIDPHEYGTNALLSMLQAITFLNCRNVTVVEPHRSRPQRRRFERLGVRLSEIHVFPRGTSVRGRSMPVGAGGTPLHSVRGHVARYGPRWGRGLLFGKHEGEFWIPQHARGSAEHGETKQTVVLEGAE